MTLDDLERQNKAKNQSKIRQPKISGKQFC